MVISEIEDDDVEPVIALWKTCGLTRPWNDPHRDLAAARSSGTSTILVGRAADNPATVLASAMVGFDGHRGWVYYLTVVPARQGRGLGRAMMTAAEEWLAARGAGKVQLMVRTENSSARAFYDALGY
jgi:ribosomal protein S18 acetylase RimI-like enzyme